MACSPTVLSVTINFWIQSHDLNKYSPRAGVYLRLYIDAFTALGAWRHDFLTAIHCNTTASPPPYAPSLATWPLTAVQAFKLKRNLCSAMLSRASHSLGCATIRGVPSTSMRLSPFVVRCLRDTDKRMHHRHINFVKRGLHTSPKSGISPTYVHPSWPWQRAYADLTRNLFKEAWASTRSHQNLFSL